MKVVKKTISLPKDLYDFATDRAKDTARMTGEDPNISGVIQDLLTNARKRRRDRRDRRRQCRHPHRREKLAQAA